MDVECEVGFLDVWDEHQIYPDNRKIISFGDVIVAFGIVEDPTEVSYDSEWFLVLFFKKYAAMLIVISVCIEHFRFDCAWNAITGGYNNLFFSSSKIFIWSSVLVDVSLAVLFKGLFNGTSMDARSLTNLRYILQCPMNAMSWVFIFGDAIFCTVSMVLGTENNFFGSTIWPNYLIYSCMKITFWAWSLFFQLHGAERTFSWLLGCSYHSSRIPWCRQSALWRIWIKMMAK